MPEVWLSQCLIMVGLPKLITVFLSVLLANAHKSISDRLFSSLMIDI